MFLEPVHLKLHYSVQLIPGPGGHSQRSTQVLHNTHSVTHKQNLTHAHTFAFTHMICRLAWLGIRSMVVPVHLARHSNQPHKRNRNLFSPAWLFLNRRNPTHVPAFGKQLTSKNHRFLPAFGHKDSWVSLPMSGVRTPWYKQKNASAHCIQANHELKTYQPRAAVRPLRALRPARVSLVCCRIHYSVTKYGLRISNIYFRVSCCRLVCQQCLRLQRLRVPCFKNLRCPKTPWL